MESFRITDDKFEAWDGGHCYIRARREPLSGNIELLRFHAFVSPESVAKLGEWAVFFLESTELLDSVQEVVETDRGIVLIGQSCPEHYIERLKKEAIHDSPQPQGPPADEEREAGH